jgi:hypothetical protein
MSTHWLSTVTAVGTGGGTAVGVAMDYVGVAVAVIGATCAIISTAASLYFHQKNYRLNKKRLERLNANE